MMKVRYRVWLVGIAVLENAVAAPLALENCFSDHVVLQRDCPIPVWGTCTPGAKVKVEFADQVCECQANEKGDWRVVFPAHGASTSPLELIVLTSDGNRRAIGDVLVGDVWIAAGQSNMAFTFAEGESGREQAKREAGDFPRIRWAKCERVCGFGEMGSVPLWDWEPCTAVNLDRITAIGYYFAREVSDRTGIPIGIVDASWAGQRIEPHMPYEAMRQVRSLQEMAVRTERQYKATLPGVPCAYGHKVVDEAWQLREWGKFASREHAAGRLVKVLPTKDWLTYDTSLGGIFYGMIRPLGQMPIVGCLWYQGCANADSGEGLEYADKLVAMVGEWRRLWKRDVPFYVAQLSSYGPVNASPEGGDGFAIVREAQRRAVGRMRRSGLVVTFDVGNGGDVHAKNKADVGHRFALLALRDVYGIGGVRAEGPNPVSVVRRGSGVLISYGDSGKGLFAGVKDPDRFVPPARRKDGKVLGFTLCGSEGRWLEARAEIRGNGVYVHADAVSNPMAVRYAYWGNSLGRANLYNSADLPAVPFCIDEIQSVKEGR